MWYVVVHVFECSYNCSRICYLYHVAPSVPSLLFVNSSNNKVWLVLLNATITVHTRSYYVNYRQVVRKNSNL